MRSQRERSREYGGSPTDSVERKFTEIIFFTARYRLKALDTAMDGGGCFGFGEGKMMAGKMIPEIESLVSKLILH